MICHSFEGKRQRKKAVIQEEQRYIEAHWDSIQWTLHDPNISSSTGCHVSYFSSEWLSSRGMGWSKKGSEQIAELRAMRLQWRQYSGIRRRKNDSAYPSIPSPDSMGSCIEKKISSHRHLYCSQAVKRYSMPGSASALHRWMCDKNTVILWIDVSWTKKECLQKRYP